jgi:hypothetical protein
LTHYFYSDSSTEFLCPEIDYFIHNIPQQQIIAEKAIIQIDTNTSDHYLEHIWAADVSSVLS